MPSTGKILIVVQGEGRGHITQALSFIPLLENKGYEVATVVIGISRYRQIPDFFFKNIRAPILKLRSPNFKRDKKNRGIRIIASILETLLHLPLYLRSIRSLNTCIRHIQPAVIFNLNEPLVGLSCLFRKRKIPIICVGHQFLLLHPSFRFPPGHLKERMALLAFTRVVAIGSAMKWALSFYSLPDNEKKNIYVIPPLLRKEVVEMHGHGSLEPTSGNYLLVYLLNSGYAENILAWHVEHPEIMIHCFTDNITPYLGTKKDNTLAFHSLGDKEFLKLMAGCRAVATTAGFESACEAFYWNKPIMLVPVKNHFEQYCNAYDAQRAGVGISSTDFNLDKIINYKAIHPDKCEKFRNWQGELADKITALLDSL